MRRSIRVAAFLTLGAAVNVTVAWLCALRSRLQSTELLLWRDPAELRSIGRQPPFPARRLTSAEQASALAELPEGLRLWAASNWGLVDVTVLNGRGTGIDLRVTDASAEFPGRDNLGRVPDYMSVKIRAGWPCRSLSCRGSAAKTGLLPPAPGIQWRDGIAAPAFVRPLRTDVHEDPFFFNGMALIRPLPLSPIWAGATINSVMYAGTGLISVLALHRARAATRRRRNLCPACAYPVGSSPVCTECGAPVTSLADGRRTVSSGTSPPGGPP